MEAFVLGFLCAGSIALLLLLVGIVWIARGIANTR